MLRQLPLSKLLIATYQAPSLALSQTEPELKNGKAIDEEERLHRAAGLRVISSRHSVLFANIPSVVKRGEGGVSADVLAPSINGTHLMIRSPRPTALPSERIHIP